MTPTRRPAHSHHSHAATANTTKPARNRGFMKRASTLMAAFVVVGVLASVFVWRQVYAANILWSSAAGSAWLTGTNWTGNAVPTGTDVAQFGANPTGTAGAGINMNGVTNNGANNQAVGAIEITSARAASHLVGNSSTTAGGTLTLNGATVSAVSNVIIRNNSSQSFTIQNTQGSGNQTMSVALANATDNIINIDGTGGVTISSIISGSSRKLTLGGAGTGALTLTGVNTYSGDTTIGTGKLSLGTTGSIANSPSIVIAGGASFDVSTLTTPLTLASGQALKGTGTGTTGTLSTLSGKGITTAANSPLQFTAFDGTAPLTISGAGTVTLAAGNPVTVNTTSALGAGDYVLIAKGISGTVAGTAPTSLTIGGSGLAAGAVGTLQITGSQLILHVISTTGKYRSRQSGNWNDFNTWQTDTGGGFVNAVSGQTPTSAADTIQIQNTHTVTVTASVNADQLTVDSGGAIQVNPSQTLTIADGTGTDLTNNGTVSIVGTIANSGQLLSNSLLRLNGNPAGSATGNAFTYGASSTLEYSASGPSQTTTSVEFPSSSGPTNVTINNSSGVTLHAARTIGGTLDLVSGNFATAGNLSMANGSQITKSDGNMTGTPAGGGTYNVVYSGMLKSTTSELAGAGLTNVTVDMNSSQQLLLDTTRTIPNLGTLFLTNGMVVTGANTLIVNGTVTRTNGMVVGNLQRRFTGSGTLTFDVGTISNSYSPVTMNALTGTFPAFFTVSATGTSMAGITGANKLNRYWTLTNTPPGVATANLTFTYPSSDVTGTVANYQFVKSSGGILTVLPPTGTPTSTSATINGVSSFSDWSLAEPSAVSETDVAVSGGNLVLTDANGGTTADTLTISLNGANVRISDPNHALTAGAGATQIDANTVDVPFASISGSIQVNTLGGNDTLTLNLAGGNFFPAGGVSFAGGSQTSVPGDKLVITGGSQGTVTYNPANANDGNVVMSAFGTVTYTGLEPITNSGTAADVIFNLPAGPNAATLADDGTSGNSMSRLSGATFETTDFSNPTGSLTINRGNAADTLAVNALPDFTATLALGTPANPFSTLTFNGAVTLASNKNLFGEASSTISLAAAASDLLTSGTGTISLKTARNVTLIAGSSLETVNGGITVEANQQAGPTAGNFTGLDIAAGALVRTTGSGNISLLGKGGADGATANHRGIRSSGTITSTSSAGGAGSITLNGVGGAGISGNNGVEIAGGAIVSSVNGNVSLTGQGAAATGSSNYGVTVVGTGTVIQSTGTATVTLNGTGGAGTLGNSGVNVDLNATVTSAVGNIQITGQGTGTTASNLGVIVTNGGAVSSTGAATVTINGTGGSGGSASNFGVLLQGVSGANHARVTSTGGDISITGQGGSGSGTVNIGVGITAGGAVTATSSANVTISGTSGTGTTNNEGVYIDSFATAGTTVSAVNGNIVVTGVSTDTTGTDQDGVHFEDSSGAVAVSVTTTGTGTLTINGTAGNNDATSAGISLVDDTTMSLTGATNSFVADTMDIGAATVTVNAGANAVTLRQKTNGIAIDLGGADSATQLGLTDAELDRFTAGTLNLGNGASGAITVSAAITRAAATVLNLVSAANIDIAAGSLNSAGGNVTLNPGTNVFPSHAGVDVTTGAAATLALTSGKDLKIDIDGTTVDSGYTQLNVAGLVNLNSANLSFAGSSYTPVGGESFIIVNNDGADAITGTFANGPTFTNFLGSGLTANLSYTGGDGNDAVLTVNAACTPPSIVYVDDSWVGTPLGTDPDMGGPATNFGCDSFATIQDGVNGVATSGTVNVAAGSYVENVTIPKALTLTGAGAGSVFVYPAVSNPNCGGAGGGSICAGGSNIMLVQADNVTISGMTLDGDNTSLTSAENFGGANIDARNGIITNHLAGVYNNIEVHHTTVKNIYLRGIYASSGGSFNFHDCAVQNVQANPASIGMFSFSGAGAYTNNTVSLCNDAISANHSRGISFTGNTVTTSASGIHTDNSNDGGGTADTISGNTVTNSQMFGYGIWVFVPYKTVNVQNNTTQNVVVGYAAFGMAPGITAKPQEEGTKAEPGRPAPKTADVFEPVTAWRLKQAKASAKAPLAPPAPPYAAIFTGNTADGQHNPSSTGVYFTTSQTVFGSSNIKVKFTSNTVVNNADGFYLEAEPGFTLETAASFNRIVDNDFSAVTVSGLAGTLNGSMENNWWGCNAGPNNSGCGDIVNGASVDFDPWLVLGISASPATIPPGGSTTVTADMTHNSNAAVPSVTDFVPQVAVTFGATNGTVFPTSGTITNGQATTTFTSNSTSSGSASATVDHETVSTPINVTAANTYTWSPLLGSTNYTLPTNWTPTRVLPQANDTLVIDGTSTPAPLITDIPTQTIAGLHLINSAAATLNASTIGAAKTLIISGATLSDLTVPATNAVTLAGTTGLTINVGSGSAASIAGLFLFQDGPHRLVGEAANAITFQSGALCTTVPGTFNGNPFGSGVGAGNGAAGSVVFANGSIYSHNAGDSPFGTAGNSPVATFQTGSLARWFTSSGFQASGRTYANLQIGAGLLVAVNVSDSGTGTFTFDNLTVKSTGSANSSLTYDGSSGTGGINIQGNISSTGAGVGTLPDVTLTPGSGGTNINKIGAGTIVFSTDGSNTRAIDLEGGATVANGTTLSLSRVVLLGLSNPHLNTLSVDTTADITGGSNGYVVGSLRRVSVPSGSSIFPVGTTGAYSPVDLANASGGGSLTVAARAPQQPVLAPATSLQRYWSLTQASGTLTTDLTFHYLDGDVSGNENNYRLIIVESGNATSFPNSCPNTCVDASANTIHRSGVTTFSDWTAAEPAAPTAVKLTSFSALRSGDEVKLQWQSGYEATNLGYNIYREQDGKRVAITPALVAGSALVAGNSSRLTAGLGYVWTDRVGQKAEGGRQKAAGSQRAEVRGQKSAVGGQPSSVNGPPSAVDGRRSPVTYWLEDIDLNGTRTLHGPIAVSDCAGGKGDCKRLDKVERSASLAGLANSQAAIRNAKSAPGVLFSGWPASPEADSHSRQKPSSKFSNRISNKLSNSPATDADDLARQRAVAARAGVKISISREGWYRITQPELIAAGLDPDSDATHLQLYAGGRAVPIKLSGDGLHLTESDYIEFYGQGLESATDPAQTYYLTLADSAGTRVREPFPETLQEPSELTSFAYTIERKERMIYFSSLLNGDGENFFGQVVGNEQSSSTLPVSRLETAAPAQLEVTLQGVTGQSHVVRVLLNGAAVGTMNFANTDHAVQTFEIPGTDLLEGDNTVELMSLDGAADISLVDVIRLTYGHKYLGEDNQLALLIGDQETKRFGGFNDANIRVIDVTSPAQVKELTPSARVSAQEDGSFAVDVQVPGATPLKLHKLLVFTAGTYKQVDALAHNNASSLWTETAGADYVMITTAELAASVEALAQLRREQGMVVQVVDVEDLYDEFTFGEHSPQAIHDYLATAMAGWTRKPHYLLLAGDASYDPKNYTGQGMNDLVPTKLVDTALMEAASDDWLADFNGDGLADISVGRLPLRTAGEMSAMVAKIVGYENRAPDPSRGALLVADASFEAPSTAVRSLLPSGMTVTTVNRSSADDATIHNQIIAGLNQGPLVANYFGHGSNGVWTGASLLSSDDAPTLGNTNRLSVFTMMTCFNGFFQDAYNQSLSEALLKSPGGAVAVWASTTLTEPSGQQSIDQEFYRLLFGAQPATLGDAARGAKTVTTDADVRRTWTLFGDPALRLR